MKETGDTSILDEPVGYADTPGQRRGPPPPPRDEHRATRSRTAATHGLPLIGHADWNDCLNLNCFSTEPDESFQTAGDVEGSRAESVMIAGLFLYACARARGALPAPRPARGRRRGSIAALRRDARRRSRREAWDGDWYLRAFDAAGSPVGSHACDEGQIFVESQGWCVLGGAGARQRPRAARARERPRAPRHAATASSSSSPPTRRYRARARRDHELPARLQGERRHLLPHEPVDHARLVPARRRRPRARVLPRDLPVDARGPDRDLPRRAVRLRADDRRAATPRPRARRRTRG